MAFVVRKVITGHTPDGKSTIIEDREVAGTDHRAGEASSVIWVTNGFPVNNDDTADNSESETHTSEDDGTIYRIVSYAPGVKARHHRTNSIDYAVIMSGSIDMELDCETVTLSAGDVLVNRGTIHNWINKGSSPCLISFAMIGAAPATSQGHALLPTG